ncbi:MAG TPA: magnesium/cobalt transporter CorA [Dehalococcoidia bacterium]|nr:magnesium/cobalt transporter CorA [Dehalococcoidia bacterium]
MITTHLLEDGQVRGDVPLAELRQLAGGGRGLIWVDIDDEPRAGGEEVLGGIFGFHPLTIDDCYNTLIDPPKIDDYRDYLFVIVHAVSYDAARRRLSIDELDLYIGRNYVVSFHKRPLGVVDELRRRTATGNHLLFRDAAFLAHALLDVVVDQFQPVVEELDNEVADVEELVLDHPRRRTLQEVLLLKRTTQRLKRTILPQRDLVNRFARGEYEHLIGRESMMYYRDIYDHTVRVDEMIETLRDLADSALNTYLSSVNNRTNDVMKALAIVAVIFLPLTLIAGIYGTNFHNVPEYGWRWGYFYMLGVMGAVAAGLIAWFRWRGWF